MAIPNPPTTVNASNGTSTEYVRVTWSYPVGNYPVSSVGETGYQVWRSSFIGQGSSSVIAVVSSLDYNDRSAVAGTAYSYWIRAINFDGTSILSSMANGFRAISPTDGSSGTLGITVIPELGPYCLTVDTHTSGGSWTGHPSCPATTHTFPEAPSCAGYINNGENISITATPDSNYQIYGWSVATTGVPFTLNPPGDPAGSQTASFKYDDSYKDVTITVIFIPQVCNVILLVGTGNASGILYLRDPSTHATSTSPTGTDTVSIDVLAGDSTSIRVEADPSDGYSITGWTLSDDSAYATSAGVRETPPNFITNGYSERTITVNFAVTAPCTPDKQLTVAISPPNGGTVSIPNGLYCSTPPDILNILPIPANGWVFSRWVFTPAYGVDELSNNVLQVEMSTKRENITAVFVGGIPTEVTSSLFYCSSDTYKDNIIAFDFTNSSNNDPSINNLYHFRVNFFTDVDKNKLVYSAFSLSDNKRWFLNDGAFSQLSSDGIDIGLSETVSIVYDPEILSSKITETQKPHLINNETVTYEKPLLCGVKYYVEVQAYEVTTNTIIGVMTIPLILACNRVDSYYWNYNKDKNNWLCSGQGKTDLRVCGGFGQAINSSIDSNSVGTFKIVWQGRKESTVDDERVPNNNIYSAEWDSNRDILYSSGQGLYDILEMDEGSHPIVITDSSLNFYITGTTKGNIKYKECGVSDGDGGGGGGSPPGSSFEAFCYPGESTLLSSSYDEIKMRVYKEDISGSLTISDEKVVPIINKKSIRLDVNGIVGAYAVRIRNMEDPEWGDWINIDSELYSPDSPPDPIGDDMHHDAYRIDNNRFLVQWDIQNYNGLRRICCQVLTMYGISNTFCIEVLANFDVPQHVFKFYVRNNDPRVEGVYDPDDPINSGDEFPTYNGQYVLSIANATVDGHEGGKMVYFDAVFSEPVYKDETDLTEYEVVDGVSDTKFNLIQQGINDKRNQDFDATTSTVFSGDFEIFNSDGIFNKDGASFIEIVFPGDTPTGSCGTDERDKYNFINSDIQEIANIDLLPEEVYQKYQRDRLSKALDINEFKQNYNADDINFKFGNPGYYRK